MFKLLYLYFLEKQRIENEKFNEDHYLADIYDNDLLEEVILKYEPFFQVTLIS